MNNIRLFIKLILTLLIVGCQSESSSTEVSRHGEISSDSIQTLLSIEEDQEIVNPRYITSTADGFALYDDGLHEVQLFSENGDHISSFGNEGRGPGEFQSVSTIKSMDDQIMVSDSERLVQYSFNPEGELISTVKLDPNLYTIDNEIVSPSAFITPTNGRNNSLATFIDKNSDAEFNLGEPVVEPQGSVDLNQLEKAFSEGKLPDFIRNRVDISAGSSYIYLFLQTEGVLQQYNLNGELNWEKSLELPEFNDEYDRFVSENKDQEPGKVYMLQYVHDMEQDEDGLYMLLKIPEKYPTTILSVDHNGEKMQYYRFNNIEHRPSQFSISPDQEWIYFLNVSQGIVYQSSWIN